MVLEILAFEAVVVTYLNYHGNICDWQSTCYQTIVRFQIWLRKMFSNSICHRLMEKLDVSATAEISSLFGTREHVDSRSVFWNRSFWPFKLPHFSESITSKGFTLWSWSFSSKCDKFYVHFKNGKEKKKKVNK